MHDRDTKFTAAFVDILKAGGVRHNALPKASPNLNVVRIVLPPLADRREDIPLLLHHFIRQFNAQQGKRIEGISEEAVGVLLGHAFPGNIRELQNIIERASVLCRNRRIEVDCLPAELVAAHRTADPPPNKKTHGALSDSEVETILRTLREHDGHRGKTAAALGVDKSTLWRKMKKARYYFPRPPASSRGRLRRLTPHLRRIPPYGEDLSQPFPSSQRILSSKDAQPHALDSGGSPRAGGAQLFSTPGESTVRFVVRQRRPQPGSVQSLICAQALAAELWSGSRFHLPKRWGPSAGNRSVSRRHPRLPGHVVCSCRS